MLGGISKGAEQVSEAAKQVSEAAKGIKAGNVLYNTGILAFTAAGFFYGGPIASFLASSTVRSYLTYQLGAGFFTNWLVIAPAASNAATVAGVYGSYFGPAVFPTSFSALYSGTSWLGRFAGSFMPYSDHKSNVEYVTFMTAKNFGVEVANAVTEAIESTVIGKNLTRELFKFYTEMESDRLVKISELTEQNPDDLEVKVAQLMKESFEKQKEFLAGFIEKIQEYAAEKGRTEFPGYEKVIEQLSSIVELENVEELELLKLDNDIDTLSKELEELEEAIAFEGIVEDDEVTELSDDGIEGNIDSEEDLSSEDRESDVDSEEDLSSEDRESDVDSEEDLSSEGHEIDVDSEEELSNDDNNVNAKIEKKGMLAAIGSYFTSWGKTVETKETNPEEMER